jgi:hypothetical protein
MSLTLKQLAYNLAVEGRAVLGTGLEELGMAKESLGEELKFGDNMRTLNSPIYSLERRECLVGAIEAIEDMTRKGME